MNSDYIREQFGQLQLEADPVALTAIRQDAFLAFNRMGIPAVKNEEWKYTRISSLFHRDYRLLNERELEVNRTDLESGRLPGSDDANELYFINGVYSAGLSLIRSEGLTVTTLREAASGPSALKLKKHFNHSSAYIKDGISALNTAFIQGGAFIEIAESVILNHPVYIYYITDARTDAVLAQPRSLVYVNAGAEVTFVESYHTIGQTESITNQVMEVVVEQDANVSFYKLQNDKPQASQVSTTHIRQIGRSVVNTVTVSLDGGIVRNNLHAILEAPHAEAHLYGLYFPAGNTHIDNHTVVDNTVPDCLSNELYKGVLDGSSTGVFNGKIFVRKDAQKTNAFQSNKNILLSDAASVNTKPQLEILADDVKCSHGCTIGSLDEEGLFYLQSRGIPYNSAVALLLQGFAVDILEKISIEPLRQHIESIIINRLGNR